MDAIKLWLKSLTGFIFICAAFDALIPDVPMKRTVKMLLGVIMSILIITPFVGGMPENVDIFTGSDEYINYSDTISEMENLTKQQSKNLYISSVESVIKNIAGEDTHMEVILTGEYEIEKIIIHKNVPALKAEIAAALGLLPGKIQMTE